MNAVQLVTKVCRSCHEKKPASEFHRASKNRDGLHSYCKRCTSEITRRNRERRIAELGEEVVRQAERRIVSRHRRLTRNATGRAYDQRRAQAVARLIKLHRDEFDHLMTLARRGELSP
jgi:hypothetical protein